MPGPDSGDGADDLMGAALCLFSADTGQDFGVDGVQVLADQIQPGRALRYNEADRLGLQPVTQAGLIFDQSGPCDLQLLEITHSI